jgi:hypothetical protein
MIYTSKDVAKIFSKPVDKLRFGVMKNDKEFSNIWYFMQQMKKGIYTDDIYFGACSGLYSASRKLKTIKISLHESRCCHVKTYDENHNEQRIIRWIRPPTPDNGYMHVASIHFPTELIKEWGVLELKKDKKSKEYKKAFIFSCAPENGNAEFMIIYSMRNGDEISDELNGIAFPFVHAKLSTGEYVHVVFRYRNAIFSVPNFTEWGFPDEAIDAVKRGGSIDNISAIWCTKKNDNKPLDVINIQGISLSLKNFSFGEIL